MTCAVSRLLLLPAPVRSGSSASPGSSPRSASARLSSAPFAEGRERARELERRGAARRQVHRRAEHPPVTVVPRIVPPTCDEPASVTFETRASTVSSTTAENTESGPLLRVTIVQPTVWPATNGSGACVLETSSRSASRITTRSRAEASRPARTPTCPCRGRRRGSSTTLWPPFWLFSPVGGSDGGAADGAVVVEDRVVGAPAPVWRSITMPFVLFSASMYGKWTSPPSSVTRAKTFEGSPDGLARRPRPSRPSPGDRVRADGRDADERAVHGAREAAVTVEVDADDEVAHAGALERERAADAGGRLPRRAVHPTNRKLLTVATNGVVRSHRGSRRGRRRRRKVEGGRGLRRSASRPSACRPSGSWKREPAMSTER